VPRGISSGSEKRATEFYPWVPEDVLLCSLNHLSNQQLAKNMTSPWYAEILRQLIWNNITHNFTYYGKDTVVNSDSGTSHLSVLAPNGDAVGVTTTINYG
jgi:gamma-glutamyltranspeptidase